MARPSRRQEVLDTALEAFASAGYDATSVAEIAGTLGVSKAAVSYHFPAKDDLLLTLAKPLLTELEALLEDVAELRWPDGVRAFLQGYAGLLLRHHAVATWIDGDRGALSHPVVGARLDDLNERTRRLLGGVDRPSQLTAASALGALWRPVRNLDGTLPPDGDHLVDAAMAVLHEARTST